MFKVEVYLKLKEVELEAKSVINRYSHEEVFEDLRGMIAKKVELEELYTKKGI